MIKQTLKEPNFLFVSETLSSSELTFQFDFEEAAQSVNAQSIGFFQKAKSKWQDYRKEFGLVAMTYLIIFSIMGTLSADLFKSPNAFQSSEMNLSMAPFSTMLTALYNKIDNSLVTMTPSETSALAAMVVTDKEEETIETSPVAIETAIGIETTTVDEESAPIVEEAAPLINEETVETKVAKTTTYDYGRNKGVEIISEDYFSATQKASLEGKYTFLKFGAKWCAPCRLMEETVFKDDQILTLLDQNFETLKVDVDQFDGINLKQHFQINAIPAFVILNAKGDVVGHYSTSMTTEKMLSTLQQYR